MEWMLRHLIYFRCEILKNEVVCPLHLTCRRAFKKYIQREQKGSHIVHILVVLETKSTY